VIRRLVRSSPRLTALARGVRGAVLGVPPPTSRPTPQPHLEDRIPELRRIDPRQSANGEIRLNLLIPTVDPRATYGGVRTAVDLFAAVAAPVPLRRIVTQISLDPGTTEFEGYACVSLADDAVAERTIVTFDGTGGTLPVGPRDVFVATFWNTAEAAFRVREWQRAVYGRAPDFLAYVIQDFEPGFYPWSAQHLLARSTYERPSETVALFNSGLLRDYFHAEGLAFEREFVFEPRLPAELRAFLPTGSGGRERRIVVYGRPRTPRNGFPLIVEALRRWQATYARAAEWAVVSAGQPHPDIGLGAGTVLRSVGKLDLDAYGQLLTTSAVGVALMVSPHPSYPPLEMAHLGMRVVTNRFGAKDLATWHPNITSAPDLSPEGVARAIADACDAYEADPCSGGGRETLRPDYLSDGPAFPFAAEVAALLVAGAAGGAPASPARS